MLFRSQLQAFSVTVLGFTVSADKAWSWGAPPVIAHQEGDTLYLHSGQMGQDLRGDLYKKVIHETYHISQGTGDGGIRVRALGEDKNYSGVNKIVARGGDGNDVYIIDPEVNVELDIQGEDGDDIIQVSSGKSGSVIRGGAGKDVFVGSDVSGIAYYGDAGDDTFIDGEGGEIIDLGTGKNEIVASGGNDKIYITGGTNTVDTGRGDDTVFVSLDTYTDLKAREGNDQLVLNTFSSTENIQLKNHSFIHGDTIVDFTDNLELFKVKDTSSNTVLVNSKTESESWGSTDLSLEASGVVDVQNAYLAFPDAHLTLVSNGITGTINSSIKDLTIINTGGVDYGDITIREKDDLNILADGRTNGGLYSANGSIDVELTGVESTLSLISGVIQTAGAGKDILLTADDLDFHSGNNRVTGSGKLVIQTKDLAQNYNIGGAGQSSYGNDLSPGINDALNLSMLDLSALSNGFSLITVGRENTDVVMFIGDIEDATVGLSNFSAKLEDIAEFYAGTITIAGDVQSSERISFKSRLAEVRRQNLKDPLGEPDAGVHGREVAFDLTEQLQLTGWIKGDEKIGRAHV